MLNVYLETLTGFSGIVSAESCNKTFLPKGYILENGSHCGSCRQNVHAKDKGRDKEPLIARGPIQGLNSSPFLLMTSSNVLSLLMGFHNLMCPPLLQCA